MHECLRQVVVVVLGSGGRKEPRLADYQWAPRESALIANGPLTSYHGACLTSRPLGSPHSPLGSCRRHTYTSSACTFCTLSSLIETPFSSEAINLKTPDKEKFPAARRPRVHKHPGLVPGTAAPRKRPD